MKDKQKSEGRVQEPFLLVILFIERGHTMKTTKTFEDLKVWQKAHQLVIKIYRLSKGFPKDEPLG